MKIEAMAKEIADLIDELNKPANIKNCDCVVDECYGDSGHRITNPQTIHEMYQIVNISDLERKIALSRLQVVFLLNEIRKQHLTENLIVERLENIQSILTDCEKFEFILEKRNVKN